MVYLGTRDVPEGEDSTDLWRHHRADPVWQGLPGTPVRVIAFTNSDSVELFLNEVSLGIKTLVDAPEHALWWDVPYQPGTLRAEARDTAGKVVADAQLRTSGPPVRLQAQTDATALIADGQDLVHVHVVAADAQGVPVFSADQEVTWTIDGPARLRGIESGDPQSHEDYQSGSRRLFQGQQLGYVQSTGTPGTVTLHLSAVGFTEAIVTLTTEMP
jgi:beta-galactosidase